MHDKPVASLTLRELIKETGVVCREFDDHLQRGFTPKLLAFGQSVQQHQETHRNEGMKARTLNNSLQPTLESHNYSLFVFRRFRELIQEMDSRLREIVNTV